MPSSMRATGWTWNFPAATASITSSRSIKSSTFSDRDQHALRAGEAADAADVVETFDLFVHAADGLDLALLVDRAGDGDVLAQGQAGKRRKQRVDFAGAGAIAVHAGVGLLEANAGGQRQRLILRELRTQIAGDDLHALVVQAAAEIRFALDVDEPGLAQRRRGGDAHRLAETCSRRSRSRSGR